jgi:prophage tail gpP-like protein
MADEPPKRVIITGGTTEKPPEQPSLTIDSGAEVAVLVVNGVKFEDWETVWVQHRWADGWPLFRFTAAENADMPVSWLSLQFKPGDSCAIYLGGQLAINGIILTRQTAYDANSHQVELSGAGKTWAAGTSSVDAEKANFDNMTLKQIADKAYGDRGVTVRQVGTLDETPFPHVQAPPGGQVFDFIDHLARQKGATLGSDHLGNMLLIGEHSGTVVQNLVEGQNIKKMQCIITNEMLSAVYSAVGQGANAEEMPAAGAAKVRADVPSEAYRGYDKFIQTPLEHPPMSQAEADARAFYEKRFRDGTQITAHATVQGWLRDNIDLWRCGEDVQVISPMAILNFIMKIQTLTFQQDNQSGTTTVLELVMPWKLADRPFGGLDSPANAYFPSTGSTQTGRSPGPV